MIASAAAKRSGTGDGHTYPRGRARPARLVGVPMSGLPRTPTPEQLAAIVDKTRDLLGNLRDAALIEGAEAPAIPESTLLYRRMHVITGWWKHWEHAMNPQGAPLEWPAPLRAAGGWQEWEGLHFALVDLYALRRQLISHWGLEAFIGGEPPRWAFVAAPPKGSGNVVIRLTADGGNVVLEKPRDWPPPVQLDWWNQANNAQERINEVIEAEGPAPTQPFGFTPPRETDSQIPKQATTEAGMEGIPPPPERLTFNLDTHTVTLDGQAYKVPDPKAFLVYKALADARPNPLTKAAIAGKVPGCKGDKTVPSLLKKLPEPLRATVRSGPGGYWLDLDAPGHTRAEKRPRLTPT